MLSERGDGSLDATFMKHVEELYAGLEKKWPCDEYSYPVLEHLQNPAHRLAFELHHALGHLHKTIGAIEAALEKIDHGADIASLQDREMTERIGKSLIDIFQLARILKIQPADLERWIDVFLQESNA